jgi:ribosomal protein L11 methyltransferase
MNGYILDNMFHKEILDECLKDFPIESIKTAYSFKEAEYKNWNETWEKEGFEPIYIDDLCVIHDTTHLPDNAGDAMDVTIDAKLAFGTGNHETTRMIVKTLFEVEIKGKSVLDCGCGTGILSIVAAKLGASHVTGYDIDEWSVKNTEHNAELNGVRDDVEVLHGDAHVLTHISGIFNIIIANINRNILLNDMPYFKDVLASGGMLILSGFYEDDIPLLVEKASTLGLLYEGKKTENGWAMIVLKSHPC